MRTNELIVTIAAGVFFLFAPNFVLRDYWPRWIQTSVRLGGGTIVLLGMLFYTVYSGENLSDTIAKKLFCNFNVSSWKLCQATNAESREIARGPTIEPLQKEEQQEAKLLNARVALQSADVVRPDTIQNLISAVDQLSPDDLNKLSDDERRSMLDHRDDAKSQIASSEARIHNARQASAFWKKDRTVQTARNLIETSGRLTAFDQARAMREIATVATEANAARSEMIDSAARWESLNQAMGRRQKESIEYYWRHLKDAVERINSFDIQGATTDQLKLMDDARQIISKPSRDPKPSSFNNSGDFATIPLKRGTQ